MRETYNSKSCVGLPGLKTVGLVGNNPISLKMRGTQHCKPWRTSGTLTLIRVSGPGSAILVRLTDGRTLTRGGATMGVYKLYTGDDGESHIEEIKTEALREIKVVGTMSFSVQERAPGHFMDYH